MIVLGFDCSVQNCSAAVLADDEVLSFRSEAMVRGQSEALLPMIGAVLAEAGIDWPEIDLIGVTVGPGTFTGIRIGLAAARGLALAARKPVAGVTTPEALFAQVPAAERAGRAVTVVIDSKRADLFVQPFDVAGRPLAPAAGMPPEAAARLQSGPLLLAGDGAVLVAPFLPDVPLSATAVLPDARSVARLAGLAFRQGRALPAQPLYLRAPDVTLPKAAPAR